MKRELLEKLGIEKDAIDEIMEIHGRDIEGFKSKLREAQEASEKSDAIFDEMNKGMCELSARLDETLSERSELEAVNVKLRSELEAAREELALTKKRAAIEAVLQKKEFISSIARAAVAERLLAAIPDDAEDIAGAAERCLEALLKEDPGAFFGARDEFPTFSVAPLPYAADEPVGELMLGMRVRPRKAR